MSRKDKKGRTKGNGPFVQLTIRLLGSEAWRSLSPASRCVYVAIRQSYNGANNGMIGCGARRAAQLAGISKNTAPRCFTELQERGLIECATPGGFSTNSKRQTEWRLTDERCDKTGERGSYAFMRWRPSEGKTKSQSRDTPVPNEGQLGRPDPATVPELGPNRTKVAV